MWTDWGRGQLDFVYRLISHVIESNYLLFSYLARMVRFQNNAAGLKIWDLLGNDISSDLSLFSAQSVMVYDQYGAGSGQNDHS